FELHDQMVIRVLLHGGEAAPGLPRDANHAVLDGEDVIGIVVLAVTLEPGVETVEVFAIEKVDDLFSRVGCGGPLLCRQRRQDGQQQRDPEAAAASHANGPFRVAGSARSFPRDAGQRRASPESKAGARRRQSPSGLWMRGIAQNAWRDSAWGGDDT